MAMEDSQDQCQTSEASGAVPARRRTLSMFGRSVTLPQNTVLRLTIGILLCIAGLMWFLPIVGLWMLPLGIAVLSIDIPIVRRWSRQWAIWLRRRHPKIAAKVFPKQRQ